MPVRKTRDGVASRGIKNPPADWRIRRGRVSKHTYHENESIIPQENSVCKGVVL